MDRQAYPLFWFIRFPRFEHNVSGANISLHAETDAILARLNLHGFPELLQITANLQEFRRGQFRNNFVLLLGNFHMLALDLHQFQVKVGDAIVFSALALEVHDISIILPPQFQ